jgi:HEAT repeat protein
METNANSPFTAEEIEQIFQSNNIANICETLVTLALYDADWQKVETFCLEFLEHPDAGVRMVAATCIGHLARIHQQLDLDLVLPALYRHQSDQGKWVAGNVDNALSCIERFMHVSVQRDPAMRDDSVAEGIDEDEEDEEERPLTPEEIEQAFRSGDTLEIERTLVALAFRNPNWQQTQAYCLEYLEHSDSSVRGVAADCIGYMLHNQHHVDVDLVLPALSRHETDPNKHVVKSVKSTLSDIQLFVKASKETKGANSM